MTLTEQQLRQMMPLAGRRLDAHLPYIWPAMAEARIDTPHRVAAFVAQLAHESGEYRWLEEIADGDYYEGRVDLGNVEPGDGRLYKGRGPIQVTGRANYRACGIALGIDTVRQPELLATPQHGTRAACWYWNSRQLSPLADRDFFRTITLRINGGLNGWPERYAYWQRNRLILGLPPGPDDGGDRAVRDFQAGHGLAADGVVGPRTMTAVLAAAATVPT